MQSVSKHVRHCVVSYLFLVLHSICFSQQLTAGAIMALTFQNLKQFTIKESLGVGKTSCIARFPCNNLPLVLLVVVVCSCLASTFVNSSQPSDWLRRLGARGVDFHPDLGSRPDHFKAYRVHPISGPDQVLGSMHYFCLTLLMYAVVVSFPNLKFTQTVNALAVGLCPAPGPRWGAYRAPQTL